MEFLSMITPIRVNSVQACELLSISRETLRQYMNNDNTFPKPYKAGESRQCKIYFDYQALIDWHHEQMKKA